MNRDLWKPISRMEAVQFCRSQKVAVLHRTQSREAMSWFDSSNRFYRANGPYDYDSLRYFLFTGGSVKQGSEKNLGKLSKPPEVELEPLEILLDNGETLSLGSPVKKKQEKFPIEFQLVDGKGKPLSGKDWEVVLPDGTSRSGVSGSDGIILVPDNFQKGDAKLRLKPQGKSNSSSKAQASTPPKKTAEVGAPKVEKPKVDNAFIVDATSNVEAVVTALTKRPVEIRLLNVFGNPMSKTAFTATFPDGSEKKGESDLEGFIHFPDNTLEGELLLVLT